MIEFLRYHVKRYGYTNPKRGQRRKNTPVLGLFSAAGGYPPKVIVGRAYTGAKRLILTTSRAACAPRGENA
jgi:hypothetical protein